VYEGVDLEDVKTDKILKDQIIVSMKQAMEYLCFSNWLDFALNYNGRFTGFYFLTDFHSESSLIQINIEKISRR